ncbi:MAG: MFS transporter [bacterium]|nr:MFS transporter [bacterium]
MHSRTAPAWLRHALLWLAGIDLRVTVLALPPVLPLVRDQLHLNEKAVAALTGLPVLLLAAAAIPGSLLIARVGARRALVIGLLVVALSSGLRGLGPAAALLFAMTFVMGIGISIVQPAVPTLVNQWLPRSIGLATAIYTNGLLIGEALGAALTLPLVMPLVGGSWPRSFAFWALPVLISVLVVAWLAPRASGTDGGARLAWMPNWRDARTWQVGLVQGGGSAVYFGANAFIPGYLHAVGHPHLVGPCLTALNVGQLPSSLIVALTADRVIGRRLPIIAAGVFSLIALAVFLVPATGAMLLGAGLFGFCAAFILVLTLALPPLLAEAHDVHRLSAGMFAIGYTYAFALPLLGGAAWDASRLAPTAFISVALGAASVIIAGSARSLGACRSMPRV